MCRKAARSHSVCVARCEVACDRPPVSDREVLPCEKSDVGLVRQTTRRGLWEPRFPMTMDKIPTLGTH